MKRLLLMLVILTCSLAGLTGCWNYVGLNDLDIVTGMAIDKNDETGMYKITLEIIDINSKDENSSISTKYIEAEGVTIFDAIRNSKKRLINKIYGGNLQSLIISKQIAQNEGVSVIFEEIMRDSESRETLSIAISEGETAKEVLLTEGLDSRIIAYEMHSMIEEDNLVTSSTKKVSLYQAYNAIKGTGKTLVLPVIRCIPNNESTVAEINGVALFDGDRLIGFQSPKDTLYYLLIMNECEGAAITFKIKDSEEEISLEIIKSNTKTNVRYENGKVLVETTIKTNINVVETKSLISLNDPDDRAYLEGLTNEVLEERISSYFERIQKEVEVDIFSLSRKIYEKDPKLWHNIEDDWQRLFKESSFTVKVDANIITSGVLKDY